MFGLKNKKDDGRKPIFIVVTVVLLGILICLPIFATELITVSFDKNALELRVGETKKLTATTNHIYIGNAIFVSPQGSDDAKGSLTEPLKTIQEAIDRANAGDVIYLREGEYIGNNTFNKSGNEEKGYIVVSAYNGERVVVSTHENVDGGAFEINGNSYIKIENINITEMRGKEISGILMDGGEHQIYITNCKFTDLKATDVYGILMEGAKDHIYISGCEFSEIVTTNPGTITTDGGSSNAILAYGDGKTSETSINNVYIDNNIVHDNVNGWSENISIAGNCEYVHVTNNKVYDCTNIGIDFYGNARYCSEKSLDQPRHCECIGNIVYNCNSFYAENAGIYVDGAYDILVKDNEVYKNAFGIEVGSEEWRSIYDDNNRVREITVDNNNIHDNMECGLRIGGWSNNNKTGVVYNCVISNNAFSHNGDSEIIISKCDTIYFRNNTFADGATYEDVVYYDEEIDSSKIKNILFE